MSRPTIAKPTPAERLRTKARPAVTAEDKKWGRLSGHYTTRASLLTGMTDVLVKVATGGAGGGFGMCWPSQRRIEINADLLAGDNEGLAARLAVAEGVLRHELGHVEHTRFDPAEMPPSALTADVVLLLEEIRMEAHLVSHRPGDAPWIRAAASVTFMDPPDDATDALAGGWLACLTQGRVVAGTLETADTPAANKIIADLLDGPTIKALDALWPRVCSVDDGDTAALIALATEFCTIVGIDDEAENCGDPSGGSKADHDSDPADSPGADTSAQQAVAAVKDALIASTAGVAESLPGVDPHVIAMVAGAVDCKTEGGRVPKLHQRPPTPDEKAARRDLSRRLRAARVRDRTVTTTTSAKPGGRLLTRGAVKADSQKARGEAPTAEMWRHRRRRHVETPRVRVAAMVDASGSMSGAIDAACGSLWALANAVVDNGGEMVATAFGESAVALPTTTHDLKQVTVADALGGWEAAADAIDLVIAGFSAWQGPKLLVVLSDGQWVDSAQRRRAHKLIAAMQHCGVAVLHISIEDAPDLVGADTVVVIDDPASVGTVVGHACEQLLRA